MPTNNLFFKFLVELLNRLRTKKPKLFVYLQYFVGVIGAVTGLPELLAKWNIVLPPAMTILENKIVAACSVGFLIASQLTTQSTINSISPQGPVNKQTDPAKLPFTAAVELKTAEKEGKPKEVDPNAKP